MKLTHAPGVHRPLLLCLMLCSLVCDEAWGGLQSCDQPYCDDTGGSKSQQKVAASQWNSPLGSVSVTRAKSDPRWDFREEHLPMTPRILASTHDEGEEGEHAGPTLELSRSTISSEYFGSLELTIRGLEMGESVLVEKFHVTQALDAGEALGSEAFLQQSFPLGDGRVAGLEGTPNINVPYDLTEKDGIIRARVHFRDGYLPNIVGEYVFRVSSPGNRFAPLLAPFRVEATPKGQSFTGVIRTGGEPLPFCYVVALRRGGLDRYTVEAGVVADADGGYVLDVDPGWYDLVAFKPGYVSALNDETACRLEAGVDCRVDRDLEKGARVISGRVTAFLESGSPLPGVQVILESEGRIAVDYTDAEGAFEVPVTEGQWEVRVSANAVYELGFVAPMEAIKVNTALEVEPLHIQLPRASALVRGVIEDWWTEEPLAGVHVQAYTEDYRFMAYGVTDEEGRFVLAVSPGYWEVKPLDYSLTQKGYVGTWDHFYYMETGVVEEGDFLVDPTEARARGTVKADSGALLGNVTLIGNHYFYDELSDELVETGNFVILEVDPEGRFDAGVTGGAWIFSVAAGELGEAALVPGDALISVIPDIDVEDVEVPLRSATEKITVRLLDDRGEPLGEYPVYGWHYDGEIDSIFEVLGHTDDDGSVEMAVFPGQWDMDLTLNDEPLFRGLEIPDTVRVEVLLGGSHELRQTLKRVVNPPVDLSAIRVEGGIIKAEATVPAGHFFVLETSIDLENWEILAGYESHEGKIRMSEPIPPGERRFYRFR